ncbi:MAG: hypothetical protein PHI38_01145 [Sulfurimonas sp.]|uniref:hypothetical protein n=1 Tax=Sulfurimonas sp. TaxID=2022749 RepID=UPI00262854C8|nr:hypothetical protein [Sulfurimonas sp.]MDD3475453.1 hypothetical protein [Sulfurimonas sp.]HUH43205.1 hypothetical protein [Sulfurimonas sp.]
MEVTRYLFQSPYSSQVQVGRAETSTNSKAKESDAKSSSDEKSTSLESKNVQESQKVKSPEKLLDIYA